MKIDENKPLSAFTTFKIGGQARFFVETTSPQDVVDAFAFSKEHGLPRLILGGGSNMIVSDAGFPGLVLHVALKRFEVVAQNQEIVTLAVGAGEPWDSVVERAVARGWWGIENLSAIPGNTGAIAVQNVGAYGQEAKQVITSVTVLDITKQTLLQLLAEDCGFAYRSSIFNTTERGRYLILSLTLRLQKHGVPMMTYPDVRKYFADTTIPPSLSMMRRAITEIRGRKLPDPALIGNAGSCFKNPTLTEVAYQRLETAVEQNFGAEAVEQLNQRTIILSPDAKKVPAAFLIELCGLKGATIGGACVSDAHALVITNVSGAATAHDVLSLMQLIRKTVYKKTGTILMPEPELIGFTEEELAGYLALE